MTIRAVSLGIALGILISLTTYYNEFVIQQASLINHLLPISVLGFALAIVLIFNPLLGRLGYRKLLGGGEIAVVVAIGLAACTFPGAGFYRTFPTNLAMPSHWLNGNTAWQSAGVMSYVPGGSSELAEGHIINWTELIEGIAVEENAPRNAVAKAVWQRLDRSDRVGFLQARQDGTTRVGMRLQLVRAINRAITASLWTDAIADLDELPEHLPDVSGEANFAPHEMAYINRMLLVHAFPHAVLPPPHGSGVLLVGGRKDPVAVQPLIFGADVDDQVTLATVPWPAWWPTLRLWGGTALLLGIASICLALIVHPQWSNHERLIYPIPRFLAEVFERDEGKRWARVATQKAFWMTFAGVFFIHLINGLGSWFPDLPTIPMYLPLDPLKALFPEAAKIKASSSYFHPWIFLSVIAFACFLNSSISFSVGMAPLAFTLLAVLMASSGQLLDADYLGAKRANMLRFGGYLALAAMIFFHGRHYYWSVMCAAVGIAQPKTPRTSIWACRVLIVALGLSIALLTTGGLSWPLAMACVLFVTITYIVLSRIVAETGMFFIQPYWMPVGVLTAMLGIDAIGPTEYIVLALASTMLVGDVRTALMANLINAFKIADRPDGAPPRRLWPVLTTMIIVGFVIAGGATLLTLYTHGIGGTSKWVQDMLPSMPFDKLTSYVSDMSARGTLAQATSATGLDRLAALNPAEGAYLWLGIGAVLVVSTSLVRARYGSWPIHPVLFLIWGTFPSNRFAFSFLVGWAIKLAIVKLGGAKLFNRVLPIVVGVIAGELAVSFVWLATGTTYYLMTGKPPASYSVF